MNTLPMEDKPLLAIGARIHPAPKQVSFAKPFGLCLNRRFLDEALGISQGGNPSRYLNKKGDFGKSPSLLGLFRTPH